MGRRKNGRKLDGVLLFNKPLGGSSNGLLQKVRWLYQANKAGHTGALDPLASGMLPICFGNATKFAQYSLDADKTYEVTAKLGIRTTTSDADGEVVSTANVNVSDEQLADALTQFRGPIKQVPSMFSALKHQGKPLYYYARQGIEIERPARAITIHNLALTRFEQDEIDMVVHCSKGTYIRSLVDDLGQVLGCGAYVTRLHRTQVAGFEDMSMHELKELEQLSEAQDNYHSLDGLLLPVDATIAHLPKLVLNEVDNTKFLQGQTLKGYQGETGIAVRVYHSNQSEFLGVAEFEADSKLQPKRLIAQN